LVLNQSTALMSILRATVPNPNDDLLSVSDNRKPASKAKKRVRFNLGVESDGGDTNDDDVENTDDEMTAEPSKLSALQIAHRRNVLGAKDMFLFDYGKELQIDTDIITSAMKLKLLDSYRDVEQAVNQQMKHKHKHNKQQATSNATIEPPHKKQKLSQQQQQQSSNDEKHNHSLQQIAEQNIAAQDTTQVIESVVDEHIAASSSSSITTSSAVVSYKQTAAATANKIQKHRKHISPQWQRPWQLYKVISGHMGWVGAVAVDPSNEWFCTGSADRTIKIWELSSGTLKLTLTGHINHVRGLAVSKKSPYMFSCGEDKQVRCWDLTTNRVIRQYHGHLSGVYCLALHPKLDILFTGGRDSACRVWDIRTKHQIMVLSGHKHTVQSCVAQSMQPQIITGSMDKTVRTWDLRNAGKTIAVLTNHKKGVRSLLVHPTLRTFMSGAADNIKIWQCPETHFLRNMNEPSMSIIDAMAINEDGVLVSGHQSGHLKFWDYRSGYKFDEQRLDPQPGSLDSEAGIMAATFDVTGTRLITCESDKTIKMWKANKLATPETHPIHYKPPQKQHY